jgi:hypothetical protein
MKKLFNSLACLLFLFSCAAYGQEITKTTIPKNELSVSTSNLGLDNLSLKYSTGISEVTWLKIGLINVAGTYRKNQPAMGSFITTDSHLNGGILIGIEKQKSISDRFSFFYGLNAQMNYNYSNHNTENPVVPLNQRDNKVFKYMPGMGLGLGFFYQFNEHFLLGVEANPSINYYFENSKSTYAGTPYKTSGFNFSLSNNGALLTAKYRF